MNALLLGGIFLRIIVCFTAGPFNPDLHFQVIHYTAEHGWPPISNHVTPDGAIYTQSYHPPLYYLLIAPLRALWPSDYYHAEHIASLILSCVNLFLIRRVLGHPFVLPHRHSRLLAMAFAAFLPQVVMFGSFVSNDTLAMLVGTLIFMLTIRYIATPTTGRLITVAAMVGLGLLTKGTFLLTGFALLPIVALIEARSAPRQVIAKLALFTLIFAALGCYKFVENQIYHGRPIVHNMDAGGPVYESQRGTWKGPATIFDINVLKLIQRPILQTKNTFSYPLLMYGTMWYPHIPESSYSANVWGYAWVGSMIYTVAIVPTILFLMGLWRGIVRTLAIMKPQAGPSDMIIAASTLLLLSNVAVVIAAGIKYDAWSNFQSRLCFQSLMPALVLLSLRIEMLPASKRARQVAYAFCWITVIFGLLYFAIEVPFAMELLPKGTPVQP